MLARLIARYRPSDEEAQATAALFLERSGDTETADVYYQKISDELREQLNTYFE